VANPTVSARDEHVSDEQVARPGARAGPPDIRVEEERRLHRPAGAPARRARRQRPAPAQRDRQVPTGGQASHPSHYGHTDVGRRSGRVRQRRRRWRLL